MNKEGRVVHVSRFTASWWCVPCMWMVCPCPHAELVEYFRAQMDKDPDMASAVAAIRTLLEFLKRDKGVLFSFNRMCYCGKDLFWQSCLCAPSGETIQGLRESLTGATDCLMGVDSSVAVSSGGELFLRFISLTSLEHQVGALPALLGELQRSMVLIGTMKLLLVSWRPSWTIERQGKFKIKRHCFVRTCLGVRRWWKREASFF